jgi:hypothetical protein
MAKSRADNEIGIDKWVPKRQSVPADKTTL